MVNQRDWSCSINTLTRASDCVESPAVTSDGIELDAHGFIATNHGYVHVTALDADDGYAELEIITGGRIYRRSFNGKYSARGLVTKAKQFAKDLHEGKVNTPQD